MNEWIKHSIEIANAPGYLDNLHAIYPVYQESERKIANGLKKELKQVYNGGDDIELVKALLKLEKFPIKDPYAAFLRKKQGIFIEYNPETVKRIAHRIRTMGYDEMIDAIEEPKEFNRQIGTLFKKWVPKIGYPYLEESVFIQHKTIAFLKGSDSQLKNFANSKLNCALEKGCDFIAKAGKRFIIGEAKFLTDHGGHQKAQFDQAMQLLNNDEGGAIRVAVLDGVVWIKSNIEMHLIVCNLKKIAITALLLKDFINSLC